MPTSILWRKIDEILWFGSVGNLKKRNTTEKTAFVESSMRQAEDIIDEAQRTEHHRATVHFAIAPRSQLPDGIDHQTRGRSSLPCRRCTSTSPRTRPPPTRAASATRNPSRISVSRMGGRLRRGTPAMSNLKAIAPRL